MATLLELRRRVRSVKNIRQITRAMKMVAAAKLRRAQEDMLKARPYADKIWDVLNELSQRTQTGGDRPLMTPHDGNRVMAVVITSDRGLCGSFNSNVIRYAERALAAWSAKKRDVNLVTVGKVGHRYFRFHGRGIERHAEDLLADLSFARAAELAQYLVDRYVERKTDAVYLIYNEFKSVLRQHLVVEPLLPVRGIDFAAVEDGVSARDAARAVAEAAAGIVDPTEADDGGMGDIGGIATEWGETQRDVIAMAATEPVELVDYLYEPSADAIFDSLLPRHVETQVYHALLESHAAEHAARMTAMENATTNAEEMIENLTLTMNKIRQEEITTEILEVVGGAEALH
jgi:F-type H+-transporting ATPase subunit gamma